MPPPPLPGEPGDDCQSCKAFFEAHDRPPQKLVQLPGKFTDYGIPIVVCPWCDGPLAQ